MQLRVAGERAVHVHDRRDPAQHLLDPAFDLRRVVDQLLLLARVEDQLLESAGDDVARRLVAADQDQQALLQELLVVESLAVDLAVDQQRDQIVLRVLAAVGDDAGLVGKYSWA